MWKFCENCESIIFSFCSWDSIMPSILLVTLDFLLWVDHDQENLKLNVGMVVDNMTQRNCIPIDSVKSNDDYSSLVHSIGTGVCIDSDKTNPTHLIGQNYDMPGQ